MEKKKKIKKIRLNTKNWGINYNKNEFYEIVESNSARPNNSFKKNFGKDVWTFDQKRKIIYTN